MSTDIQSVGKIADRVFFSGKSVKSTPHDQPHLRDHGQVCSLCVCNLRANGALRCKQIPAF